VTYTTAKETGLERPPHKLLERFEPDDDPGQVYERFLARRPSKPLQAASAELFKGYFERAYAEDMDWRFERGGFSEDEIRKNLEAKGTKASDDQVQQVHGIMQAQVNQWLQTKLRENFRARANIADGKWRSLEDRIVFVHDRLSGEEVKGVFAAFLDWSDEDTAQESADKAEKLAGEAPPREAFARMLAMLPAERTVKKLGHITDPVAADVYLGPDDTGG
jgi:hypothetical protein